MISTRLLCIFYHLAKFTWCNEIDIFELLLRRFTYLWSSLKIRKRLQPSFRPENYYYYQSQYVLSLFSSIRWYKVVAIVVRLSEKIKRICNDILLGLNYIKLEYRSVIVVWWSWYIPVNDFVVFLSIDWRTNKFKKNLGSAFLLLLLVFRLLIVF